MPRFSFLLSPESYATRKDLKLINELTLSLSLPLTPTSITTTATVAASSTLQHTTHPHEYIAHTYTHTHTYTAHTHPCSFLYNPLNLSIIDLQSNTHHHRCHHRAHHHNDGGMFPLHRKHTHTHTLNTYTHSILHTHPFVPTIQQSAPISNSLISIAQNIH